MCIMLWDLHGVVNFHHTISTICMILLCRTRSINPRQIITDVHVSHCRTVYLGPRLTYYRYSYEKCHILLWCQFLWSIIVLNVKTIGSIVVNEQKNWSPFIFSLKIKLPLRSEVSAIHPARAGNLLFRHSGIDSLLSQSWSHVECSYAWLLKHAKWSLKMSLIESGDIRCIIPPNVRLIPEILIELERPSDPVKMNGQTDGQTAGRNGRRKYPSAPMAAEGKKNQHSCASTLSCISM